MTVYFDSLICLGPNLPGLTAGLRLFNRDRLHFEESNKCLIVASVRIVNYLDFSHVDFDALSRLPSTIHMRTKNSNTKLLPFLLMTTLWLGTSTG